MTREKYFIKVSEILKSSDKPLNLNEISKALKIKSDSPDYELLKDILTDLTEKQIIERLPRRKYRIKPSNDFSSFKGIFRIYHSKGFVETENPKIPKISIKERYYNTALDGDTVLVQLHAEKKGKKPKGEITEIVSRKRTIIVGTIEFNGYFHFLVPDDLSYYVDFLIPEAKLKGAKPGDKVKARLIQWEDQQHNPTAEVVENLGKAGVPVVEYDSIIKEFDLPQGFEDEVIVEAKQFKAPSNRKVKDRLDLRNEIVITIDPYDAKDFDDALSLKILENGNYYLGVHIADVSHYVAEGSALDIEARNRGNSIYLVDRVIPMLPEELSNEICSLKPDEPRFTFSCFMEIDVTGNVLNYDIKKSLIKSKRRFNYDEVLQIIETGEGDFSDLILELYKVSAILRERRFKEGGINFETREYKFVLDENKYPIDVKVRETTKSTSLVEECMLIANKTVASHFTVMSTKLLRTGNLPCLYRVHESPDPKKILEVIEFIKTLGSISLKKAPTSKDINKIIAKFHDSVEKPIVNQVLIRAMSKAVYSHSNIGHYGLGFKEYVHFTSPIRRYPDLIIHRLLHEFTTTNPDNSRINFLRIMTRDSGKHCSDTERVAMEAERASIKLTHTVMTSRLIGDEFEGTISGVTGFGLFVLLDNIYAEGLLHIRDLKDDYYIFDETNYRLVGRRTKKIYGFGSRIKVRIIKVNIDKRTIDLAFVK